MNKKKSDPIVLSQPETGVVHSIVVTPGSDIVVEGDFDEATTSRQGVDLKFVFDKGGTDILVDFFTTPPDSSVILQLPDGVRVSVTDILLSDSNMTIG